MSGMDLWKTDEAEYPWQGSMEERLRFQVRYAALAPSSHNTQPWSFRIRDNIVDLYWEESRWLKVADDDQRELYISMGCALENLLVAAEHFGLSHQTDYLPNTNLPKLAATVHFAEGGKPSPERPAPLFAMIRVRHTNHGEYEKRAIPDNVLQKFQDLCVESEIKLFLTSDKAIKQQIDDLVAQADVLEFVDPAFREELGYWIGQGVFGTSWLISKIGKLAVTHINLGSSQAEKDSTVLMSSPVLGLISSIRTDRISQVQVGQVYERLSLLAASFGIWCQPMSQILQVEEVKQKVVKLQPDTNLFPQHPFRLGYAAPQKPHTPRRNVTEMLR